MFAMAVGVCNLLKVASDEPTPGPFVIGADVPSTYHERPAGVVERFQCSEHGVSAPSSEISAVLKSEPTRAALSDKADGFEIEAGPFAFDATAFGVGAADVLTRRASGDEVGKVSEISQKPLCREGSYIVIKADPRVVLCV
nr:hypothetical protein [Tardibacter chloracetimidivorans]